MSISGHFGPLSPQAICKSKLIILGGTGEEEVRLRSGRYGWFVERGAVRASVPADAVVNKTSIAQISLDMAIGWLDASIDRESNIHSTSKNILRILDTRSSVRVGRYGHYVFYWPAEAPAPRSVSLKKCLMRYLDADCDPCAILDWIRDTKR